GWWLCSTNTRNPPTPTLTPRSRTFAVAAPTSAFARRSTPPPPTCGWEASHERPHRPPLAAQERRRDRRLARARLRDRSAAVACHIRRPGDHRLVGDPAGR